MTFRLPWWVAPFAGLVPLALACGGLGGSSGLTLDPSLPRAVRTDAVVQQAIVNAHHSDKGTALAASLIELAEGSTSSGTALVVLADPAGDCWVERHTFTAAGEAGASLQIDGAAVRTSCPLPASERSDLVRYPSSAMNAVHDHLPEGLSAAKRDPELEAMLVARFNDLGWKERFYGAVLLGEPQEKFRDGVLTSRTMQVQMLSRKPDGTCMSQNFGAEQERSLAGWERPRKSGVGGQRSAECAPTEVIDRGMAAGAWPDVSLDGLPEPLDPRVPAPGMRDAELEADLVENYNSIGWKEEFFAAVIVSDSFSYKRVRGVINARTLQVVMLSRRPDGSCMFQRFGVIQQREGDTFGKPKSNGVGGQTDIACPAGL